MSGRRSAGATRRNSSRRCPPTSTIAPSTRPAHRSAAPCWSASPPRSARSGRCNCIGASRASRSVRATWCSSATSPRSSGGGCAALERECALTGQGDDPAEAGIIVIGADGGLRFSTPAGEGWAARLRDANRDQHPTLPTAVLAAVAGLRAGSQPGAAVVAPVPGGFVRVEASAAGAEDAAIVLTAVRPPAPPDIPPAWPLTSGDREVVGLLLHGLSNAQIAARLHRSEEHGADPSASRLRQARRQQPHAPPRTPLSGNLIGRRWPQRRRSRSGRSA